VRAEVESSAAAHARTDTGVDLHVARAIDSRAEQRTKFVFIRWVGNSISPMQRKHAMENKNRILDEAIKVHRCRCRGAVRWLPKARY